MNQTSQIQEPATPLEVGLRFHAFLLLNAQVLDSGRGDLVHLTLASGLRLRAQTTVEALRQLSLSQSEYRASLHFRTNKAGYLIEPLMLRRIRHIAQQADTSTIWSAAGEIVRLDQTKQLMTIKVFPEQIRQPSFRVTFRATDQSWFSSQLHQCVKVSGGLVGKQLQAHVLEPIELTIPAKPTREIELVTTEWRKL
jgi:hypothetical protein